MNRHCSAFCVSCVIHKEDGIDFLCISIHACPQHCGLLNLTPPVFPVVCNAGWGTGYDTSSTNLDLYIKRYCLLLIQKETSCKGLMGLHILLHHHFMGLENINCYTEEKLAMMYGCHRPLPFILKMLYNLSSPSSQILLLHVILPCSYELPFVKLYGNIFISFIQV